MVMNKNYFQDYCRVIARAFGVPRKLIKTTTINKAKGIVTVVFNDSDVQMARLSKGDTFDASIGIALCIAYHEFGSKTKFRKFVKEQKVIEKESK